jgi:hypothetical protein
MTLQKNLKTTKFTNVREQLLSLVSTYSSSISILLKIFEMNNVMGWIKNVDFICASAFKECEF